MMADATKGCPNIVPGGKRGVNWFKSETPYGYNIAACISALVKDIRRGKEKEELAVFWAYQVAISGEKAEEFLWEILRNHCIEDIGLANPDALVVVSEVMKLYFNLPDIDDRKYAVLAYAVSYMARSKKTRYTNDLFAFVKKRTEDGSMRPEIPDYAVDVHLPEGRKKGRGQLHYLEEAAVASNEDPDIPNVYRGILLKEAAESEKK